MGAAPPPALAKVNPRPQLGDATPRQFFLAARCVFVINVLFLRSLLSNLFYTMSTSGKFLRPFVAGL